MTYTYDNIGQLKSALGSGDQSTENHGYLYDTAWNRKGGFLIMPTETVMTNPVLPNTSRITNAFDSVGRLHI